MSRRLRASSGAASGFAAAAVLLTVLTSTPTGLRAELLSGARPPPPGTALGAPGYAVAASDTLADPCPLVDGDLETVTAVLARWTDRRRRLDDVPGLALGVACGPDRTWTRAFGMADRDRQLPATDTTLFRIASITKVFTALAVMQLRDAGRLALDDPVAEHLEWFELENSEELPAVTIEHLLTHTSGLPTNSAATDFNRMTQPTAREAIEALPTQRLLFTPGSASHYSNLGFAVLGALIHEISGLGYRRYLAERVLGPLGLAHTVPHPGPEVTQAVGYYRRHPDRPRRPADFLHLAFFTPAGGMASTAKDMVGLISYLLDPARSRGVLAPETLREMQRVSHPVDSAGSGSGLAWSVDRRSGRRVISHGGGLPSQTSHFRVDLAHHTGAVVLTNAEDAAPASYAVEALALLELAVGAADREDDANGGAEARPRPEVERYTGRFRFRDREVWVIKLGGELGLVAPALDLRPSRSYARLRPIGGHRFHMEGGIADGETVEFVVDGETSDVIRLRMPSLTYRRAGSVSPSGE